MQIYKVGGCVRDALLGIEAKDIDYVVVGSSIEQMLSQGYELVGKDFPVFLKNGCEYALARVERKIGHGYNGFETHTQDVTLEQDLFRRDLTINAMAISDKGELIDPYHGAQDLEKKILRHVSEHFSEDPVRILRIARFSARYNFSIAPQTIELMKNMVLNGEVDHLTPERIWKDVEKTLTEPHLPNFFNTLEHIGALNKIFKTSHINTQLLKKDNTFEQNLCYVFSQVPNFKKWQMPQEYKILVEHFMLYNKTNYTQMQASEKIEFIKKTKARHDPQYAQQLMQLCSDNSFEQLMHDLELIKSINFQYIISNSEPKEINQNITNAQIQLLNKKTHKLKI